MCSVFMNLSASQTTTVGVRMTARAKLNSSALGTPASMPVDVVAPEREDPRNGKHSTNESGLYP